MKSRGLAIKAAGYILLDIRRERTPGTAEADQSPPGCE